MRNHLTLGALNRLLKANVGRGLCLFASIDSQRTVYLSGCTCEASDENFLFHAVDAKDSRCRVDTFAAAFDTLLAETPIAESLRIWVEVDGVGYPVRAEHVAADSSVMVMLLQAATSVRP
jgi:hypothetical protein